MITPIFRDRNGHSTGFMPVGEALREMNPEGRENDPVHHDGVFLLVEDMVVADIFGGEIDEESDWGEDVLIASIDKDASRKHNFSGKHSRRNSEARVEVWRDPSFRPADAVHPIHRDGSLYYLSLSKARRRTTKAWNV